jgi:hypothetical protein
MTITATIADEQHSASSITELCELMGWQLSDVKGKELPFTFKGHLVTGTRLVKKGVQTSIKGKPRLRSSVVSIAKSHLGYTESMRPNGETCSTCAFRIVKIGRNGKTSDWCGKGGFAATRKGGGCDEWGG